MEFSGLQITRGCWIDLFELPKLAGKVRRIFGPALYLQLRIDHDEHPVRFGSLIAGPTTYAQLFAKRRPERGGLWLTPREKLLDLSTVKTDLTLDSIRILNRPPMPSEPGYSAFARQMGLAIRSPRRKKKRRKKKA